MQFLQPILLAGLPLAALPILIHLINRQRHRTLPWAAMMFLLDARRMARGMARLRYWLIMATRMLAIAAMVFAASRPIMSGWLGTAVGGRPDTTIIVLDRSASMEQQDVHSRQSKRSTALRKLSDLIRTMGGGSRLVLIESTANTAWELDSSESLVDLPETTGTAASSDIPGMLETALDYIVNNQTGRTDVWICSDLSENDWKPQDGRWSAVREGFSLLQGVRFNLLCYPGRVPENVAVRVGRARRRQSGRTTELLLDVELSRAPDSNEPISIPVEFVINGARSVVHVELAESEAALQGHPIVLDEATTGGWGRVEIPADGNPQDNVFYFVFAEPPEHHITIVSKDPRVAEVLRLASISPADPAISYAAAVVTPDRIHEIDWKRTSLVLWQGPLPDGVAARQIIDYVGSGRPIIFFPPQDVGTGDIFGAHWQSWQQASAQPLRVATWRGDSDLLSHTQGGAALPVGALRMHRYCPIAGAGNVLARLEGGTPLLTRSAAGNGPIYYCATLPLAEYSDLAQQGVVLYVMIQRALSLGASTQGNARHYVAGTQQALEVEDWAPVAGPLDDVPSSSRPFQSGAYRNGDVLVALNRPAAEDASASLDAGTLEQLFGGRDVHLVEDRPGDAGALASEIWRAFACAVAAALLLEAWLCMPERPLRATEAALT